MAVGTTRGKRRLGRYIRPLMARSELSPKQVAEQARCAPQTIFRLLSGDNLPRIHLFLTILSILGATADERARAIQLWEGADVDSTAIVNANDLPANYRRFRMDELEAHSERTLDTVILPGLLQTPGYAAAMISATSPRLTNDWNENEAAAERLNRQAPLHRTERPLRLHCLINEGVLRRIVGGPEIMREQLDHLLTLGELPNITVQALPFDVGAFGAMSGPLVLLSFPEEDEPDAAYVESLIALHRVENDEYVSTLSAVWDGAAALALSPDETAATIRTLRNSHVPT